MAYFSSLLAQFGIFVILATSLNLINGLTGMFCLGHAGLWAIGAYVGSAFSVFVWPSLQIDFPLLQLACSCVVAMIASGAVAFIVGVACLRLKGDYLAIATLGLGEIVKVLLTNWELVGGPRGFTGIPPISSAAVILPVAFLCLVLLLNVRYSSFGRALMSIREDELASNSLGISTTKMKIVVFVLGSSLAGLAGPLYAHEQQFLHPENFNFMASVLILLQVILGGMGSFTGSVLGVLFLLILPEVLKSLGPEIAQWRMVLYSLLLIVLMLLRPQGILGKKELGGTW